MGKVFPIFYLKNQMNLIFNLYILFSQNNLIIFSFVNIFRVISNPEFIIIY